MLTKHFGKNNIDKKIFSVITLLFVSAFGWFFMSIAIMNHFLYLLVLTHSENLIVWGTFYGAIVVSSIIGSFISNKVNKHRFLYGWTILGVAVSFLPIFLNGATFLLVCFVSLLLGASFGLGMPSCLAYFADLTVIENRGRIGGVSFLVANISAPILSIAVNNFDMLIVLTIFALIRGLGLSIFFSKPEKKEISDQINSISFFSILSDKTFLLYFGVWFIFPIVDRFESALIAPSFSGELSNLLGLMNVVEPVVAAIAILVAGTLCDLIGRKKIMLSGFAALGGAYAIIGIFSALRDVALIWYIYFIVDAIAWGIFLLTFVLIIWGDLSQLGAREKYYALGAIPFFVGQFIPKMLTPSLVDVVPLDAAFSLAALFLFAALFPLLSARETLPEKKIELRRLKNFAEEAKKAREKYESKNK